MQPLRLPLPHPVTSVARPAPVQHTSLIRITIGRHARANQSSKCFEKPPNAAHTHRHTRVVVQTPAATRTQSHTIAHEASKQRDIETPGPTDAHPNELTWLNKIRFNNLKGREKSSVCLVVMFSLWYLLLPCMRIKLSRDKKRGRGQKQERAPHTDLVWNENFNLGQWCCLLINPFCVN